MRIACVHAQIKLGGADKRLIDLANALAKTDNDVKLYLMSKNNYNGYWIDPKIQIVVVAKKSSIPKTQWLKNVKMLNRQLKADRIDVAISFLYPINIALILASNKLNTKVLISERGDPNKQPAGGIWKWLRNRTYRHTDGMVFQTAGAKNYYVDNLGVDGEIIHNPVDIGDLRYCPEGNKVLANVGLLEPHKNQARLLRAFAEFAKDFPEYRLRICGDGYLKDQLTDLTRQLGIEDKVIWMGKIPDAVSVICKDDFFVLSSDFEGMPNALMEAMALGMPCISTDCVPGGARELIIHGVNGLLAALDDGHDLAKQMKLMAGDRLMSEKLGNNAEEIRNSHSAEVIYNSWISYIMRL